MSGFAVFCCSKNSDMDTGDKVTTLVCSLGIGLLQLALTAFLLLGWCWSCVWGLHYVDMSSMYPSYVHCSSYELQSCLVRVLRLY